jgi:hypothetical protein
MRISSRRLMVPVLAALAAGVACRPSRLEVIPVPPEVRTIEGYGSVKVSQPGGSVRSRFSFFIEAGRGGKVEILDALNRSAAEVFLLPDEAYFVLRRDKVYWKADPAGVIEKFLGVRLDLAEVTDLLCGRRPGGRDDLRLEVRETFGGGRVPRRVEFESSGSAGVLTLLAVTFNVPAAENSFALDFLSTYAERTWDEIERILRRED